MSFDIATMLTHGIHGAGATGIAFSAVRASTGLFFALSGWNKLTNKARHATILQTMIDDHVVAPRLMQWWVPGNELLFGTLLVLGLFSAFSAAVLAIICIVACCCEARKRVAAYAPINGADRIDDYLYLPEVQYIGLLAITIFGGGGTIALDTLLF